MAETVLGPLSSVFRALARTFVPEATQLEEGGWQDLERIVEDALATRPPRMRRQLATLIRLLDLLPVLRYGRRFATLDFERRLGFLRALEDSRLLLLRRGIWGLRTLVFMGYYARLEAAAAIGYRADPRGWEARR